MNTSGKLAYGINKKAAERRTNGTEGECKFHSNKIYMYCIYPIGFQIWVATKLYCTPNVKTKQRGIGIPINGTDLRPSINFNQLCIYIYKYPTRVQIWFVMTYVLFLIYQFIDSGFWRNM